MHETGVLPARKPYGMLAFWGLHTLMLVFFMVAEATGFHFPVGSSLFYFTWIAIWMTHGLSIWLIQKRDAEAAEGDAAANQKFWRRLILAAHSALYISFGPLVILWWLMARVPGPQQPGEGQGLWIYPVWLIVLLLHSGYVMMRERQVVEKPKREPPSLRRLMTAEDDLTDSWDGEDFNQKNKR